MPKQPKEKTTLEIEELEPGVENPDSGEEKKVTPDQQERSYYYDDACGYETYIDSENDEQPD